MTRIAPDMRSKARTLRNEATPEERALWGRLRHARPRFTRQLPVGRYILDFACRSARLGAELDGSQHFDAIAYDEQRTRFLENLGWQILRFWNSEVRRGDHGGNSAPPQAPPPFREGLPGRYRPHPVIASAAKQSISGLWIATALRASQ